jgi:hypothetical protein
MEAISPQRSSRVLLIGCLLLVCVVGILTSKLAYRKPVVKSSGQSWLAAWISFALTLAYAIHWLWNNT